MNLADLVAIILLGGFAVTFVSILVSSFFSDFVEDQITGMRGNPVGAAFLFASTWPLGVIVLVAQVVSNLVSRANTKIVEVRKRRFERLQQRDEPKNVLLRPAKGDDATLLRRVEP